MPLFKRVNLAVGAHARHTYTHYDQLLKVADWDTARAVIGPEVVKVLIRWRGEDIHEPDGTELEDILREVIVINDDPEEAADDEEYEPPEPATRVRRSPSVEYIPARRLHQGTNLDLHKSQRPSILRPDSNFNRKSSRRLMGRQQDSGFPSHAEQPLTGALRLNDTLNTGEHKSYLSDETERRGDRNPTPWSYNRIRQRPPHKSNERSRYPSPDRLNDGHVQQSIEGDQLGKRKSIQGTLSPKELEDTQSYTLVKRVRVASPVERMHVKTGQPQPHRYDRLDDAGETIGVLDFSRYAHFPSFDRVGTVPMYSHSEPDGVWREQPRSRRSHHLPLQSPLPPLPPPPPPPARLSGQLDSRPYYAPDGRPPTRKKYIDADTGREVPGDGDYEILPSSSGRNHASSTLYRPDHASYGYEG